MFRFAAVAALALLAACATAPEEPTLTELQPAMQWDFHPEGDRWTSAAFTALEDHGSPLLHFVPADIDTYCPGYEDATETERAAFWSGLFSALAFHESTWNPRAVGGGGLWYGLVQIDPRTARQYGCEAKTGEALKDGAKNLSCAVRIASRQVLSRGDVSRGMRDWGPFHNASKRAQMAAWTREQSYCSAS